MLYAEKVEFVNRPAIAVGGFFNGLEVTKIEVYHEEYPDHSEMLVIPYTGNNQLGKFWNYPCGVTYMS